MQKKVICGLFLSLREVIDVIFFPGQERYRSMTTSYYRGAHGCLLMFDVTKEDSFSNLDTW